MEKRNVVLERRSSEALRAEVEELKALLQQSAALGQQLLERNAELDKLSRGATVVPPSSPALACDDDGDGCEYIDSGSSSEDADSSKKELEEMVARHTTFSPLKSVKSTKKPVVIEARGSKTVAMRKRTDTGGSVDLRVRRKSMGKTVTEEIVRLHHEIDELQDDNSKLKDELNVVKLQNNELHAKMHLFKVQTHLSPRHGKNLDKLEKDVRRTSCDESRLEMARLQDMLLELRNESEEQMKSLREKHEEEKQALEAMLAGYAELPCEHEHYQQAIAELIQSYQTKDEEYHELLNEMKHLREENEFLNTKLHRSRLATNENCANFLEAMKVDSPRTPRTPGSLQLPDPEAATTYPSEEELAVRQAVRTVRKFSCQVEKLRSLFGSAPRPSNHEDWTDFHSLSDLLNILDDHLLQLASVVEAGERHKEASNRCEKKLQDEVLALRQARAEADELKHNIGTVLSENLALKELLEGRAVDDANESLKKPPRYPPDAFGRAKSRVRFPTEDDGGGDCDKTLVHKHKSLREVAEAVGLCDTSWPASEENTDGIEEESLEDGAGGVEGGMPTMDVDSSTVKGVVMTSGATFVMCKPMVVHAASLVGTRSKDLVVRRLSSDEDDDQPLFTPRTPRTPGHDPQLIIRLLLEAVSKMLFDLQDAHETTSFSQVVECRSEIEARMWCERISLFAARMRSVKEELQMTTRRLKTVELEHGRAARSACSATTMPMPSDSADSVGKKLSYMAGRLRMLEDEVQLLRGGKTPRTPREKANPRPDYSNDGLAQQEGFGFLDMLLMSFNCASRTGPSAATADEGNTSEELELLYK